MNIIKKELLPHYTYEDYKHWEGRWELIKGIPYAMSPQPSKLHQFISLKIARYLDELLESCSQCFALVPVDWKITEDTIVQPDNLVVCGEEIEGQVLNRPPVLIFEILSPSTKSKDKVLKFNLYQEAGVKYYVLVEPETQKVEIFVLKSGQYRLVKEFVKNGTFVFTLEGCEIEFDFTKVFPK